MYNHISISDIIIIFFVCLSKYILWLRHFKLVQYLRKVVELIIGKVITL